MNAKGNRFICSVYINVEKLVRMAFINRIGLYYVNQQMMMNKYDIEFSKEVVNKNVMRLTNQVWKLIPMRENEEDWQKQLETVLLEIVGLDEIFLHKIEYLQILSKLEGLKIEEDIDFQLFRKTVFEVITLLAGCKDA